MAEEATKLTWAQIEAEIRERSGVELNELPHYNAHVWVPKRTAAEVQVLFALLSSSPGWTSMPEAQKSAKIDEMMSDLVPMTLVRGAPWPPNPSFVIANMFADDTELRVYAIAAKEKDSGASGGTIYTITKANPLPTYGSKSMALETWVDLLSAEWEQVEEESDPAEAAAEEEREKVIAYLESLPAGYLMADAIEDLDEALHLVERDEPDGDGEEPKPAQAANGAPAEAAEPAGGQKNEAAAPAAT